MTQPVPAVMNAARNAMNRLAGRETPLIENEWYVAAFGTEIGRTLFKRTLLGKRVVFYRTERGSVVALEDRCPHRSFPLSSGSLDGDTVVCGYHGLRFNEQGDCIEAPALAQCPKNVGVRTYPVVETGPVIWIWMGAPERADPARICARDWMGDSNWEGGSGYFHMKANYVNLHENLLDTSHLSYMHAKTIGTPDYVKAPTQTEMSEGRFALIRTLYPTVLPPALGKLTGLEGVTTAARIVRNEFHSPSFYQVTMRLYDGALDPAQRTEYQIRIAHMPTPETQTTTHYFFYGARDFVRGNSTVTQAMLKNFMIAFEEDVVGLELQEDMQRDAGPGLYELSLPSDALGTAMRRYIKDRADTEHAAQT